MAPSVSLTRRPANPRASAAAVRVLRFLQGLPAQRRILSGQFDNFGTRASLREPTRVFRATGRWPALAGFDYADFTVKCGRGHTTQWLMNAISTGRFDLITHAPLAPRATNRAARRYWRAGGLVTIGAHFPNPANPAGGGLRDRDVNLADLLARGTATHRRWLRQLDVIASALAELRDAGVVVLWRPFHEMNGAWFWWGQPAPRVFGRVWRHMFDYFSRVRGLDNLLWVFGPNMGDDGARYFPGDRYVDLVGFDAYTSHLDPAHVRGHRALSRLGKPFGFSEFGPHGPYNPPGDFDYGALPAVIRRHFPRASYFLAWNAQWSPARNRGASALYSHPAVITRTDLPPSLFS